MKMSTLKVIFVTFFGLYILNALVTLNVSLFSSRGLKSFFETHNEENKYRFNNPRLASKVLGQLDIFKPVNHSYFTSKNHFDIGTPYLGLRNDDEYCEKHRAYIVAYPEVIFDEINFIVAYDAKSLVKVKVAQQIGDIVQPYIGFHMSKEDKESKKYDLEPYVSIFFTAGSMNLYKQIGKHFSCLSQESGSIPGNVALSGKLSVAKAIINYAKRFEERPHCFSYDKFFPKTWILNEKQDCQDFFNNLNSQQYQILKEERRIVYIRKVSGAHRGNGVQPVNEEEEAELKQMYANGKKCGKVTEKYIVQNYVHNPLLLNGHKFDFRMYMLVASTNPLIAFYHDGFLRVTLASYDVNSNEKKVLLTNLALNKQIYNDAKGGTLYEGMDEEQLKLAQQWSLERLETNLLENGIINDPNWLDNYLRPEFKKAMVHLLRLASPSFLKTSSVYQLFGVDFMLDTNLNLWFIEANSGPEFSGYSKPMEKFIVKMLQDHFKIVMGLMRSRMKRVINYVNKLIEEGAVEGEYKGTIVIHDLEAKRIEFEEITRNNFEKEFEPSDDNGFMKIIDENYEDTEMYQGLISRECL